MGDLLWLLFVLTLLILFVAVLTVLVRKLERQKKLAAGDDAADAAEPDGVQYSAREWVLSPGERAFLPVLREAVQLLAKDRQLPLPLLLASVRMAEVLEIATKQSENRSLWQTAHNKITKKQFDFVICNPETTKPLLVVELDDQSHARADRKDRDEFVNRACASAKLPILHVRAAANYSPQILAQNIGGLLPSRT